MIFPSGKRKEQVKQSGFKQESLFSDSLFKNFEKTALAPLFDENQANQQQNQPSGKTEDKLQQTVNDSQSGRLNQNNLENNTDPSMNQDNNEDKEARYDKYTGQPLMGVDGPKLAVLLTKWLAEQNETANLAVQGFNEKNGTFTLTLGPRTKMVMKG